MNLDELGKMKTGEVFNEIGNGNTEVRDLVLDLLKQQLGEDHEFCERLGKTVVERQEEINAFFDAIQRIAEMPEEDAKALIRNLLNESDDPYQEDHNEIIDQIRFKKPENLLLATPKVIRKLFDGITDFTDGGQIVDVNPRNHKGTYIVPVELFFPSVSDDNVQISRVLTPFDKQVQNAIFTLIEMGCKIFTAKQVYEVFAGKSTTDIEKINKVKASIDKLCTTMISINWTKHAKLNHLPVDSDNGDYIVVKENMLMLRQIRIMSSGQEVDAYGVIDIPALYRYAKSTGQLSTVNRKLLDVPINNTDPNIILKNDLLERIDTMKKRPDKSRNIRFDTLYNLVEVGDDRTLRGRVRKTVETILKAWKKEGFIADFVINKEKQQIVSVSIVL